MTIAVTTSPAIPAAKSAVTFNATGDFNASVFEYALTSKPSGSTLGIAAIAGASITFDVAGTYGFTVTSYKSAKDHIRVESGTFNVTVGSGSNLAINAGGPSATLHLIVVGANVAAASLIGPSKGIATQAITDTGVVAALGALVGVPAAFGPGGIDLDFQTDVRAIQAAYAGHIADTTGGIHLAADVTDVLTSPQPFSDSTAVAALADVIAMFKKHELNTTAHTAADTRNAMVTSAPSDLATGIVAKADFRRVYGHHLAQTASPASHGVADATNTLSAPRPLPVLIAAFLDACSVPIASAPPGFVPG